MLVWAHVRPAKAKPSPSATAVDIMHYPFNHKCKPKAAANPTIVQK